MTDPTHREAVIDGLRALADFLTGHPDMPVPEFPKLVYLPLGTDEEGWAEVDRVAAILGVTPTSKAGGSHYVAARMFGPLQFEVAAVAAEQMRRHEAGATYLGAVQPEGVSA